MASEALEKALDVRLERLEGRVRSREDLDIRRIVYINTIPRILRFRRRISCRCGSALEIRRSRGVTRSHLKFENQLGQCCRHESGWTWWSLSGRSVCVDLGEIGVEWPATDCDLGCIDVQKQDGDAAQFAETTKETVADVCALPQHGQEPLSAWYVNGDGVGIHDLFFSGTAFVERLGLCPGLSSASDKNLGSISGTATRTCTPASRSGTR